jgi:hypothetical protein
MGGPFSFLVAVIEILYLGGIAMDEKHPLERVTIEPT